MKLFKAIILSFVFAISSCGSLFNDVQSITLNKESVNLFVDETFSLEATVNPSNATNRNINWESSDRNGLTVKSNGLVTAVKAGSYTVTCISVSNPNIVAHCSFTVINKIVDVSSIELNKTSLALNVGDNETLIATVKPNDATDKSLNWSSSDENGLSVNSSGLINAKKAGEYIVTCSSISNPNIKATCSVNVINPVVPVTSIELDSSSLSLLINEIKQLTATVKPNDATDKSLVWSSSNDEGLSVDQNGLVTAKKVGKYVLTCASKIYPNIKTTCDIEVSSPVVPVTSIELDFSSLKLNIDESKKLVATVKPDNATDKSLVWSSSDNSGLSVDNNGLVSANKAGKYVLTCASKVYSGVKATCDIEVLEPIIPVSSIELDVSSLSLNINETKQFTATVKPNNATDKSLVWSSSDNSGFSVDNNGLVTANKAGKYVLTCASKAYPNVKATCDVIVSEVIIPVTKIELNKNSLTLKKDESEQLTVTVFPSDATNKDVIWSSSNTSLVKVENGLVTCLGEKGDSVITCKSKQYPDIKDECSVHIEETIIPVTSLSIKDGDNVISSLSIKEGKTKTLSVEVKPTNATDKTVEWSSSNTNVLTVNDGAIKGIKKGTCELTVSNKASKVSTSISVTVSENEEETYLPSDYYGDYYPDDFSWTNGEDLKNKLFNLSRIKRTEILNYGKNSTNWSTNQEADHTEYDFEKLDVVYSSKDCFYDETNVSWQREHAFCASLMTGLSTGDAVDNSQTWVKERANDFLNLFAADGSSNSTRSNYNFGNIEDGEKYEIVGDAKLGKSSYNFEPNDKDKGRLSRALFYMATMYGDSSIKDSLFLQEDYVKYQTGINPHSHGNLSDLIVWSDSFSPDRLEMQHNNSIQTSDVSGRVQGNRNFFTDYPELVDYVFGDKINQAGDLLHLVPSKYTLDMYSNSEYYNFAIKSAKRTFKIGETFSLYDDLDIVNVFKDNSFTSDLNIERDFDIDGIEDKHVFSNEDFGVHNITIRPSINNPYNYSKANLEITYSFDVTGDFVHVVTGTKKGEDFYGIASDANIVHTLNFDGIDFNCCWKKGKVVTFNNSQGTQFGTNSEPVERLYFETKNNFSFNGNNKFNRIYVYCDCNSNKQCTLNIYVNNVNVYSTLVDNYGVKQKYGVDLSSPMSGKIKIEFVCGPNKGGIYIHTIAINSIS